VRASDSSVVEPERSDPRHRFLTRAGLLDPDWYAAQTVVPIQPGDDLNRHYLDHGAPTGLAPNPQIARLQDPPVAADPESREWGPPRTPDADDPRLLLEVELVRDSGLFDAHMYAAAHGELIPDGEDPLVHFCRIGWRQTLRPNADFDTWWYWVNHLDPRCEDLNPFVHFLLIGRAAGYPGLPPEIRLTRTGTPPDGRPMRRICLFAGYDAEAILDDYVVDYVRELSRFADVYYLSDGYLPADQLAKLDGITRGAWAVRHGAYDFGSYSMLARDLVGWDRIAEYDEVLLVNDSCYLLGGLDKVFARMDASDCAWWGLQATKGLTITQRDPGRGEPIPMDVVRDELLTIYEHDPLYDFHVGSYFLAYRRPVIEDPGFRRILDSVHKQRSKLLIVMRYEIGLTHYLIGAGFLLDTFVEALYPFHPIFTRWYFELLEQGFPVLKKYLLYQNHYDVPDLHRWRERVAATFPLAPVDLLERNLLRTAPADKLARSFAIVSRPDGVVEVPEVRKGRVLRDYDRRTPIFEHWWAFPVSIDLHELPDNSRAIFESVKDDPSIKKVVLTRSRRIQLSGENVVVVPLDSPQGQHHLMRSGQVLVSHRHRKTLSRWPIDWGRRRLVIVRHGLPLQRRGTAEIPSSEGHGLRPPRILTNPRHPVRALLTSSDLDQLAELTAQYPVSYDACWRTGLPQHDFLVMPEEGLPTDFRADLSRLRRQLDGRRLLLFAPGIGRSTDDIAYRFREEEVTRLASWAQRNGVVLGLREDPHDLEHAYLRQLADHVLDLSSHRQPHLPVVLRATSALLTDVSGVALDFLATGRPVLSFVHDLDTVSESLYFDLDHVMPRPVAQTFEELIGSLETVFDEPDPRTRARHTEIRRLFFDQVDGRSSDRVVQHIRGLYAPAEAP
jgi:hypothetical protein